MNIHESAENYLERIYMLKSENGYVKSIDIAKRLNVSKPSVSFAMKQLKEDGYITMDENKYIDLTEKGLKIAKAMYEKYTKIAELLMELGIEKPIAYEDACKMEHDVSPQTFEALKKLLLIIKKHKSSKTK